MSKLSDVTPGQALAGFGHKLDAKYYRAPDGSRPVRDFAASLGPRRRPQFDWATSLLRGLTDVQPEMLPPQSYRYSEAEFADFRELRCPIEGATYRVIYRRLELVFILLHAFRLDAGDTPQAEKELAVERWDEFLTRSS
jgi:phage-related protein